MKKIFWNSDRLLSLTAMVVSVCTLLVFLYQTSLIKKQQYMSVFPYMTIASYGIHTKSYKLVLDNEGIGPAIIKSVKIEDKEGRLYEDVVDFLELKLTEADSVDFYYANLSVGRLIPEKGMIEVVGISDNKLESANRIYDLVNNLNIEIEYESIYGETWFINNKIIAPIKR